MTIESLIAQYGLPAIGLGAGFEGETAAVLAGVVAHRGILPFWQVAIVAALGSFVADQIFFSCGRYFRDAPFVARLRAKPIFRRAIGAFEERPTLFTFGFRFIYGLRTVSPIAIGTTSLPTPRFVVINAAAAIIWALMFVSLGYVFGQAAETLLGRLAPPHWLIVAVLVSLAVAVGAVLWARSHRKKAGPA